MFRSRLGCAAFLPLHPWHLCRHVPHRASTPQRSPVHTTSQSQNHHLLVEEPCNTHPVNPVEHGPVVTTNATQYDFYLQPSGGLLRHLLSYNVPLLLPSPALQSPLDQPPHTTTTTTTTITTPSNRRPLPPPLPTFPLNGDLLPHPVFRQAMKTSIRSRDFRKLMKEQLLRCQWPSDILRVMSVAMQRKDIAKEWTSTTDHVRRALYRSRNNASDSRIVQTINVIVKRLEMANLPVHPDLIALGVRFAARSRSLKDMKRYLKYIKLAGGKMNRHTFRCIIAKFSVGHRGLGEIRNGRWKRSELLQVLLGFDDTPPEEAYHLRLFLQRDNWQIFHVWIVILARCRAVDELWKEWEYWRQSPQRNNPRRLHVPGKTVTTATRGDHWFIEQMAHAGDMEKAWQMLRETAIPFAEIKPSVRARLLDGAEYATVPDELIRIELLQKYATQLTKIEAALGIEWVSPEGAAQGYHVVSQDLEDALEKLADPGFELEPDYGFPWDKPTAEEKEQQRNLMEAQEEA